MLTANPLKRRIIRLAAIGGSILALGAALVGLAAASASASANQTSACNGCHGTAGSSEINISTDVTAKTVVAGSTFTIAASYTNGGTGQTQINWPTSFSNIGITRDNTLFNPTPRYSTAAIAATGSLTSTLTAPATVNVIPYQPFTLQPTVENTGGYIAAGVTVKVAGSASFGGQVNQTIFTRNLLCQGDSVSPEIQLTGPAAPGTYDLTV